MGIFMNSHLMDWNWPRPRTWMITIVSTFIILIFWTLPSGDSFVETSSGSSKTGSEVGSWCPLPVTPTAAKDGLKYSSLFLVKEAVQKKVGRLSAAVNVPTVSYGDGGNVDTDSRY